ncbi:hypothetical protein, partial [Bacillus subtilis]|uniref:hypothetical protein n=1 Tax=Bacillus subtilis TaxID=1423 RepID=UPI003C209232
DARKRLEYEGYTFEDMGRLIGYKVTRPPVDVEDETNGLPEWAEAIDDTPPAKEYSEGDIAAIVAAVLKAMKN